MEHGEEMIRLILPKEGYGPYVEGALNGVNFRIPTGVPVEVPMRIYRVLEESRTEDPSTQWMTDGFTVVGGRKLG
ncbi:MAG: hypothetical protein IJI97_09465 [Clostridia bacterium]|jgi:hypothetical protein|nr:hypothetical protein [Clostridia bacterium]MBQ6359158.1 hypothetical protein [Clostridia bacterium]MBQ6865690.1 hypothetical protein [Clostridia bacterium]MBQ6892385.1 hypothetical protein [Clostridia bacterium]MBQ7754811.1 hypothetical protein [Clostridia bacterium]